MYTAGFYFLFIFIMRSHSSILFVHTWVFLLDMLPSPQLFEDISTDRISMSLFLIVERHSLIFFYLFFFIIIIFKVVFFHNSLCPSIHLENVPESILLAFMLTTTTDQPFTWKPRVAENVYMALYYKYNIEARKTSA